MEPLGKINESFGGILGKKGRFFFISQKVNLIYWMIVHFNMFLYYNKMKEVFQCEI